MKCDGEVQLVDKNSKFSIKDPMSMSLIITPVRGVYCDHFDCFCLDSWAIFQQKSTILRWRCPICKKKCYKVVIDNLWIQILNIAKTVEDAIEVEFNEMNE